MAVILPEAQFDDWLGAHAHLRGKLVRLLGVSSRWQAADSGDLGSTRKTRKRGESVGWNAGRWQLDTQIAYHLQAHNGFHQCASTDAYWS